MASGEILAPFYVGLNFKLDVGLYRLDQQVACQRYRQTTIDAKDSIKDQLVAAWGNFSFAPAQARAVAA